MPEYLHLPPVAQGVMAITAVALAVVRVVRLLTASRPFWAWEKVPVWVQKLLPALLMAVAALPTAIEHARSWLDVVVGFVVTGSLWFTASRGDKRPPENKSGGPRTERVKSDPKVERISFVKPEPDDEPTPPSLPGAAMIGLVLFVALLLPSCAGWKPVVRSVNDIAKDLCVAHFGAKSKLSLEDVAKQFCETREDIEPWTDAILSAKREAAPIAEARKP
jgi:hypothetical protein